jgi:hypothetical protein
MAAPHQHRARAPDTFCDTVGGTHFRPSNTSPAIAARATCGNHAARMAASALCYPMPKPWSPNPETTSFWLMVLAFWIFVALVATLVAVVS